MKQFKPIKELIRALYEIAKAIKGESDKTSGESTWQDAIQILFKKETVLPVAIIEDSELGENTNNNTFRLLKDIKITEKLDFSDGQVYRVLYEEDPKIENGNFLMVIELNYMDKDRNPQGVYFPVISFDITGVLTSSVEINGKTYYYAWQD